MILFVIYALVSSEEKFKKCKDLQFCIQNIDRVNEWSLKNPTFNKENNDFTANLLNQNGIDQLKLNIYLIQNNSFRILLKPHSNENIKRYKLSEDSFVVDQKIINQHLKLSYNETDTKCWLTSNECKAEINYSPFYISISDKYNSMVYINFNQNLIFENSDDKTETGIDFSFQGKNTRIFGFLESSFNFEDTLFEPKRLTNINKFSEYGHVPLFYGHSSTEMMSLFWLNPTDTFVSISTDNDNNLRNVRLLSEGGYVDFVVFTCKIFDILKSFTDLTGRQKMPPIFSLGFHLSKNGYNTQTEIESLIDELEEFPYDLFVMDESHLHQKQPFRFNLSAFPTPNSLFEKLSNHNRFLIRTNGPYIPEDDTNLQYKYAKENNYFIYDNDGITPFKGVCLSGLCFLPDFLNPDVHNWYSSLYQYESNEIAHNVYFLNNMNEPTIFSSVEETLPKQSVCFNDIEVREIRNLYGLLMTSSTYKGIVDRNEDKNTRPFVLSRSFFAGSQKYSFIYEKESSYDLQQLISKSIIHGLSGIPLTIFDFDEDIESSVLKSPWFQAGVLCFSMFHQLKNDFNFEIYKNLSKSRYEIAPFLYTAIRISHETGIPPVLPLFALYPEVDIYHDIDDQFILGQSLMIAPIFEKNAEKRKIIIPPGLWYNMLDGQKIQYNSSSFDIDVEKSSFPIFLKGGSIIPLFKNIGKSMEETYKSPLKLFVACDEYGNAHGPLYIDDGVSFDYEKNIYLNRLIVFEKNKIHFEKRQPFEKKIPLIAESLYIDEIVFYGLKNKPEKIGDNSVLICNERGDICSLKNLMLYPKNVNEKELDKKKQIIIIIGCSFIGFSAVAIAIACIYICHIEPKKKEKDDDDNSNIDTFLIEN